MDIDFTSIRLPADTSTIEEYIAYIRELVAQGGPHPDEYERLNRVLSSVGRGMRAGTISRRHVQRFRAAFGRSLTTATLQGFSYLKPHGYTGDFEIIDLMYQEHVTDDPELVNWDHFFQAHAAPEAVRHRKTYIKELLSRLLRHDTEKESLPVLNVASGPMRDVYEFFKMNGQDPRLYIECVDYDATAIAHAKRLCEEYLDQLVFHNTNALSFRTDRKFKLIWSAGLFDYLSEKGFKFLLEHLLEMLLPDGELVIGNFSENNPSRDYMEVVGDWYLYHRRKSNLIALAKDCGIERENIRVGAEASEINLFLHIKRGEHFISLDDRG